MSVVFAAVWSVLLLVGCRSTTSRLLGVRVTRPASLIAAGMGIAVAAALLLALPANLVEIDGARINQVFGYAGLTAATILGLRVLAAIGRHG
jgi:hypothetical protein